MAKWFITGTVALLAAVGAGMFHPVAAPFGALLVLVPLWVYRSRGRLGDEKRALEQLGKEATKSTESFFAALSGGLVAVWLVAEAAFGGSAELLGELFGMAGHAPLPLAYWGTAIMGVLGMETADITTPVLVGFAVVAFGIALGVKAARDDGADAGESWIPGR
jgi:hypothetical protein